MTRIATLLAALLLTSCASPEKRTELRPATATPPELVSPNAVEKPARSAMPEPAVPPLLGESIDAICFAATNAQLAQFAAGWVMPMPNRAVPIREQKTNPFTGAPLLSIDYRSSTQPPLPRHSAWPNLKSLQRVETIWVQPFHFAALVHAISGAPADDVSAQLFGQELITSREHEAVMFVIPATIAKVVSTLRADNIDAVADRWQPLHDEDGTPHPPLEKRKLILHAVAQLFATSDTPDTRFFLFWSET